MTVTTPGAEQWTGKTEARRGCTVEGFTAGLAGDLDSGGKREAGTNHNTGLELLGREQSPLGGSRENEACLDASRVRCVCS